MREKQESREPARATDGPASDVARSLVESGFGGVWVRGDGAICVGGECLVIKVEDRNLTLEVNSLACGPPGEELVKAIMRVVGQGGHTKFRLKSQLLQEEECTPPIGSSG